jgi:hypothetical protein
MLTTAPINNRAISVMSGRFQPAPTPEVPGSICQVVSSGSGPSVTVFGVSVYNSIEGGLLFLLFWAFVSTPL